MGKKSNKRKKNGGGSPTVKMKKIELENSHAINATEESNMSDYSSCSDRSEAPLEKHKENNNLTNKYSSKDNGPFIVFGKQEKIKVISLAKDLKMAGVINIVNIYKINENLAKIIFKDKFNANKCLDLQTILKCELFIPEMFTTTYGVIRDVENEILLQDLKDNIRAECVISSIERLKSFDPTSKTLSDTTTVKIGFRSTYLPRKVSLFDGILKEVSYYLPRPMFCTECVSYGHTKKKCRSSIKRCTKCGLEIKRDDNHICNENNCRFCLSNHITNSKDCDERKIQIKIRNTMTKKKITYREAKQLVSDNLKIDNTIDMSPTNFPNLSINTARINHINKFNTILKDMKSQNDKLVNLLDQIKQRLSNYNQNHPGNDLILIEISQLLGNNQEETINN